MPKLPCVILAGGLSRRMGGGDKALRPLAGRPVLAHVIWRLVPQVGAIAVNANGDPSRFAAFGRPVLADSIPGHPGPLAGILAALDWAAELGFAEVLTVAADLPFLPSDLARRLGSGPAPAIAATPDASNGPRLHPTCGLWPVSCRADLRTRIQGGLRRLMDWDQVVRARQVVWVEGEDPFFNLNCAEDLAEAERRLRDV